MSASAWMFPPSWSALTAGLMVAVLLLAVLQERRRRRARRAWGDPDPRGRPGRLGAALRVALLTGAGTCAAASILPAARTTAEAMPLGGAPELLVVALDISRSMEAGDVRPSRLDAARSLIRGLVERTGPAAVGLVLFAGEATVVCPVTPDIGAFHMALAEVAAAQTALPGGSALGDAIVRAVETFGSRRARRTMLIVSDGESTAGEVSAAITRARDAGVVILAVGIGTRPGAPMTRRRPDPGEGPEVPQPAATRVTRLEPAMLQEAAAATGGMYVEATDARARAALTERLRSQAAAAPRDAAHAAAWLLLAAFLALTTDALAGAFRRNP